MQLSVPAAVIAGSLVIAAAIVSTGRYQVAASPVASWVTDSLTGRVMICGPFGTERKATLSYEEAAALNTIESRFRCVDAHKP